MHVLSYLVDPDWRLRGDLGMSEVAGADVIAPYIVTLIWTPQRKTTASILGWIVLFVSFQE
jgi:hypothetical protein